MCLELFHRILATASSSYYLFTTNNRMDRINKTPKVARADLNAGGVVDSTPASSTRFGTRKRQTKRQKTGKMAPVAVEGELLASCFVIFLYGRI